MIWKAIYSVIAISCWTCVADSAPLRKTELAAEDVRNEDVLTADLIRQGIIRGNDVEVMSDMKTALVYKDEAVYQVPIPQLLVAADSKNVNSLDTNVILDSLNHGEITLNEFIRLTGIEQNAGEVFQDFDVNDDGLLTNEDISQVERNRVMSAALSKL